MQIQSRPATLRPRTRALVSGVLALVSIAGRGDRPQTLQPAPAPTATLHTGAERITGLRGVDNVGRVAPGIYRGSAPSAEGLDSLKVLGIKTVVNLRNYHGSTEAKLCRARGLDYIAIPLTTSDFPRDASVRRFLEVVTNPAHHPVYFHCWRGKDRTGMMCAIYRMAVEDWPLQAAVAEMEAFGFYRHWRDLRTYVDQFPRRKSLIWPGNRE